MYSGNLDIQKILRKLISLAFIFFIVAFGFGCSEGDKQNHLPVKNVLLIIADDMGTHLGVMGNENVTTPTLDSLAKQGMFFTEAHATQASCSPSRSSLLTGMYPHSNGHWRNTVGPSITEPDSQFTRASTKLDEIGVYEEISTLPEILNREGFYTGITQKWHLSPPWKFPFKKRLSAKGAKGDIRNDLATFFSEAGTHPFFLQMNITNTHRPFNDSIGYSNRVHPDSIKIPPLFPNTNKARKDLSNYYTMVNGVDQVVQTTLNVLEDVGMAEETLVIFSSDHGWPYHRAKATAYYMGTHVPLIIAGPGIQKDQQSDALVSLADIMPTILDYMNLGIPQSVQGRSLRPILERKEVENWRSVLFTEHNSHGPPRSYWYPSRAVFNGEFQYIKNLWPEKSYKFPADLTKNGPRWNNYMFSAVIEAKEEYPRPYQAIHNTINRPKEELYNIEQDPYEMINLANNSEFLSLKKKLKKHLEQWMETTNDPFNPREIRKR